MDAFEEKFGADPDLASVKNKLAASIGAVIDPDKGQQFPILIIISIIGLIIQIITYCQTRRKKTREELREAIKNVKSLPRLTMWRWKRKIRKAIIDTGGFTEDNVDLAYGATLDVGESLSDAEIDALFAAAEKK